MAQSNAGDRTRSSAELLHLLVSSSPVWVRGLVLLALAIAGVTLTVIFSIAVLSGRAVEFWPPKISSHDPPIVKNCKELLALYPAIQKETRENIEALSAVMRSQYAAADETRRKYIDIVRDFPSPGGSEAAELADRQKKEADDTRDLLSAALLKQENELAQIRETCLGKIASESRGN
jgi:hypothetical protein